jgi:hypothetical protein
MLISWGVQRRHRIINQSSSSIEECICSEWIVNTWLHAFADLFCAAEPCSGGPEHQFGLVSAATPFVLAGALLYRLGVPQCVEVIPRRS